MLKTDHDTTILDPCFTQRMITTVSGCHMHLGTPTALLGKLLTTTMVLTLVSFLDLIMTLSGSKSPIIWNSSPRSQRGPPVSGGCELEKYEVALQGGVSDSIPIPLHS